MINEPPAIEALVPVLDWVTPIVKVPDPDILPSTSKALVIVVLPIPIQVPEEPLIIIACNPVALEVSISEPA